MLSRRPDGLDGIDGRNSIDTPYPRMIFPAHLGTCSEHELKTVLG